MNRLPHNIFTNSTIGHWIRESNPFISLHVTFWFLSFSLWVPLLRLRLSHPIDFGGEEEGLLAASASFH